ncbi:MAG TPA: hypothetical protein VHF88_07115 [Thermoleophilaceae bacterium]|nr:hypothetical protein [Thermoleophilaceae bacterium]
MPAEFRPRGLLEHLTRHGVDFVVVGGVAAALHGSERNTFDLDICPAQDADNLEALGTALTEIDARLRGIEEDDVPFVPDARSLAGIEILTLSTSLGSLDILVRPHGSPSYAALSRRATRLDVGSSPVLVASLDDLIAMKRQSDRPKDREDVERLETIARLTRRLAR